MTRKSRFKRFVTSLLVWAAFLLIALFVLGPILWGLRTSLAHDNERAIIPPALTLEHYAGLFTRPEVMRYIRNSLIVSAGTISVVLPIAVLAAYGLARFEFRGKEYGVLLLVMPMIPAIALLVPLISYMNRLGLYNSLFAVIIAISVFNLPFSTWMLKDFIMTNPISIEECALLDGCSRFQMLTKVALPMMAPGLGAVIVFIFVMSWNNYMHAFALTSSPAYRVLPQGILSFLGAWGTQWGGLTAAGTIALIPPMLFFFLFRRWFVAGLFGHQLK